MCKFCKGRKFRCVLTKAESKKQRNDVVGEVIKVRRGGKRKRRMKKKMKKRKMYGRSGKRQKRQNGRSESGEYRWNGF